MINKIHRHFTMMGTVSIAAGCLIFALVGSSYTQKSEAASCTVDSKLVNSCRPWLGATVGGYTMTGSDSTSQYNFANKRLNDPSVLNNPSASVTLNKHLDIIHTYKTNNSTSFSSLENTFMAQPNTYLFINYKPETGTNAWTAASGGNSTVNSRIDALADSFKAKSQYKFFLTIFHEPENDVSAGNCTSNASGASAGSPSDYVNMWHNVRSRFDAKGVSNVVWVMNYMGYSGWNCLVPLLWPGNSYVDWIMYDPYSIGTTTSKDFTASVGSFYSYLSSSSDSTHDYLSKAWGLAEHGYSNANGNSTQANAINYWNQGATAINNNTYPKLKAYVVFDTSTNGTSQVGLDFNGAVAIDEQTAFNNFANAIFALEGGGSTTGDSTKPTVSITSPANGATASGTITIGVSASDNIGISKVEIFWDGTNLIRSATTQNTYGWGSRWSTSNAPDGAHTLSAIAYDAAGNTATSQISINISNNSSVPNPAINSFTANPQAVSVGSSTTLSWSSSNAVDCSIDPGGPQGTTASAWQTLNYSTQGSVNYTLTCRNSVGSTTSASLTVSVSNPPTPPTSVVLSADKTNITQGESVLFSWSSSNSSQCTLNPSGVTASGNSSSKSVSNIVSTTTFSVTCSNAAGDTNSNEITVNVSSTPLPAADPVINSFTASSQSISSGQTSELSWSTSNVVSDGCKIEPGPLTSTSANGTWVTPALTSSVSYTLSCVNSENKLTSKSVSITVNGQSPPAAPAPTAPVPNNDGADGYITTQDGVNIVNTQKNDQVTSGELITLDPSVVSDKDKQQNIIKVEYYLGEQLIQTVTEPPFALDTTTIVAGEYTITQRIYYKDGSKSQHSQIITIEAASSVVNFGTGLPLRRWMAIAASLSLLGLVVGVWWIIFKHKGLAEGLQFIEAHSGMHGYHIKPSMPGVRHLNNELGGIRKGYSKVDPGVVIHPDGTTHKDP